MNSIPSGRWQCVECTFCISCKAKNAMGTEGESSKWVMEYKTAPSGNKVFSHTMCPPCHKAWKKGQFCPECNVVFGCEEKPLQESDYSNCWVCSRQHHLGCVGQATFICAQCQRKTLEKTISPGNEPNPNHSTNYGRIKEPGVGSGNYTRQKKQNTSYF